jgi:hypothetical protein
MSLNQKKMANAFSGFLSQLANLQYRIAMTTTDISDATADKYGAKPPIQKNRVTSVQDGRLVTIGSSKYFTPAGSENAFLNAIEIDETASCDANGYVSCPSNDERGIFAARLAIERNEGSWIRPTAHMAVIVLSDEDERGRKELWTKGWPLESYDRWENLMGSFQNKFPAKTMSVHPIVVKDDACAAAETQGGIGAFIGTQYLEWSATVGGNAGSICDSNFSANLGQIASYVQNQAVSLPFECRPMGDAYSVTFNPQPANPPTVTANWTKMKLEFSGAIPPNTSVTLKYECKDNK